MRIIAIIIALAVGASGCAIAAAKGPGRVTLASRPDCNSSKGAVVADGLAAGVLGVSALALGSADEGTPAVVVGLLAAAFTGSAIAGSRSADRCIAALDEYDVLVQNRMDEMGRQRVETAARDNAVEDPEEAQPEPIAPPVAVVKPPPTMTMRPPTPAPPTAASGDDDDDEASDDDQATADIDAGLWAEFWREVTP